MKANVVLSLAVLAALVAFPHGAFTGEEPGKPNRHGDIKAAMWERRFYHPRAPKALLTGRVLERRFAGSQWLRRTALL